MSDTSGSSGGSGGPGALYNQNPQVRSAYRRSRRLQEALSAMERSAPTIRGGWGELGARLLAQALIQRASNRADAALDEAYAAAMRKERDEDESSPTTPSGAVSPPPQPAPAATPTPLAAAEGASLALSAASPTAKALAREGWRRRVAIAGTRS